MVGNRENVSGGSVGKTYGPVPRSVGIVVGASSTPRRRQAGSYSNA